MRQYCPKSEHKQRPVRRYIQTKCIYTSENAESEYDVTRRSVALHTISGYGSIFISWNGGFESRQERIFMVTMPERSSDYSVKLSKPRQFQSFDDPLRAAREFTAPFLKASPYTADICRGESPRGPWESGPWESKACGPGAVLFSREDLLFSSCRYYPCPMFCSRILFLMSYSCFCILVLADGSSLISCWIYPHVPAVCTWSQISLTISCRARIRSALSLDWQDTDASTDCLPWSTNQQSRSKSIEKPQLMICKSLLHMAQLVSLQMLWPASFL